MKSRYRLVFMMAVLALAVAAPGLSAEPTVYGGGITQAESVGIAEILDHPEAFVGKTVRVEGRVSEVCPRRGCWIDIADARESRVIRFKVRDGEIVFPAEAKDKRVIAEGVFTRIEMDDEEALAYARHLADERGEPFDPATSTIPRVLYRIQGTGAILR